MAELHRLDAQAAAEDLAIQLASPTPGIVWERALEVFGDERKARHWMRSRKPIFFGKSPDELVVTQGEAGQRLVLEVLLRIDYGVFS